jgi:hypothetical protein
MGESDGGGRGTTRLMVAAVLLAVSCGTGALLTLRADAQARADATTAAPPMKGAATATQPSKGAAATPQAGGEPSNSSPVQDDPVIAPDPHESADNNVSFPVDI